MYRVLLERAAEKDLTRLSDFNHGSPAGGGAIGDQGLRGLTRINPPGPKPKPGHEFQRGDR
jgi:hypothetical protein